MQITLSDNTKIEIMAIDIAGGRIDWRRTEGYVGACVSEVTIDSFATLETDIVSALGTTLEKDTGDVEKQLLAQKAVYEAKIAEIDAKLVSKEK